MASASASDKDKEELKEWLVSHTAEIVEHLDPVQAVSRLRAICPDGFDDADRDKILLEQATPRERSEALLRLLLHRAHETREAFLQIIQTLHPHLGAVLWPVRYQVLWLCPSPRHAAMVVHTLKQFAATEFLPAEDGGPNVLVRKSSGGALGKKDTLIRLVFPAKPEFFSDMLEEMVQDTEEERVHLAVLTGVCEALCPDIPAGWAVIPVSASGGGGTVHCHTAERVRGQRETLGERIDSASWLSRLTELYKKHAYMDYQAVWLGRLYVELLRGERSTWLEQFGWEEGGVRSEGNRAIVARNLLDWDNGRLARYVLKEKRTWTTDATSPLGLAPRDPLLSRISERREWYDSFPSVIEPRAPSRPAFNPLSTPGGGGVVTDTETHHFYELCSRNLQQDSGWLACKCVCHDTASASHELTAFTAVTMAMEVVQLLRTTSTDE